MCGCVRESEDVKVVRCARLTHKCATRAFFLTVCSCTCLFKLHILALAR